MDHTNARCQGGAGIGEEFATEPPICATCSLSGTHRPVLPSRPRSRRSRVLLPVLLGVGVFGMFGAGTTAPGILTGVAAIEDDQAPVGAVSADVSAGTGDVAPLVAIPDPRPRQPSSAPPVETLRGYRWPLAHPRLTLPFGPTPWGTRVVDGKLFHDG